MVKLSSTSKLSNELSKQKVAIYIRVSTHYQIDKDSLKVQKRELIAYAEMILGISDYYIFEDPGFSAKNTDRPDFQKMMSRIRSGEFSHLLVWKIDRISRNLLDFATMYQELKDNGVVFVSKNEQFDTSSAMGEAMLKIILVFAELERNMTSERVTAVMLSRANNGQWNGGRIPYGYNYDKKTKEFTVNESEKAVIDRIMALYKDNQSVLYTSRRLNEEGYRTRKNCEWSTAGVYKILKSRFYIGDYVYNVNSDGKGGKKRDEGEWVVVHDHHTAILSEEEWERNQFVLERNKRGGVPNGTRYIRKNIHIFAGKVSCGVCGGNMTATLDRRRANGWRPSIYGCHNRRSDSSCSNKFISDILLGPFVFSYISNIIRAKESFTYNTSTECLQRKLLYGKPFESVLSINSEAISSLIEIFKSGKSGMEYKARYESASEPLEEQRILLEQKRKYETAINRLKSIYLYGEEEIPETEFIIERKKILDNIARIEQRLNELNCDSKSSFIESDELIGKASYFIMVNQLLSEGGIDYQKFIRTVDPKIPQSFIDSIITKITCTDGRVTSITFKNGIEHIFTYKES